PAHSEITFSVRHLAISKVRGTFETFDVTVVTTDEAFSIEASIDVASVNTNQEQRDAHLRTSDFFKVDEFPTATFTSTG
ncbi:YceI family protein, partial [Rhizobium johnstonii]|uniref:YceI family protein n=1 Tax=Rhizobium johnstonii TaxID=3019933 RepID=UPI003F9687A2